MTSWYLLNPIRTPLQVIKDRSLRPGATWDDVSDLAASHGAMVATAYRDESGLLVFSRIGGDPTTLTGYSSNELIGRTTRLLQCASTNRNESLQLIPRMRENGVAEIRIINQRKSGEIYGCCIVSIPSPFHDRTEHHLFGVLAECPIKECP